MKQLKIALPKGRMVKKAYDVFASFGYTSPELDDEIALKVEKSKQQNRNLDLTKLNNNTYEGQGVQFIVPRSADLAGYVDEGISYMGILGKDSKDEYELARGMRVGRGFTSFEIDPQFNFQKMRFSIIGKEVKKLRYLEMLNQNKNIKVATSYKNQARAYMMREYPNYQSEFLDWIEQGGEVELAVRTDRADIGFEIVESGNSLLKNGLVEYNEVYPIPVRLISNNVALELDDRVAELTQKISGGVVEL